MKFGLSGAEIDEVVQDTLIHIARKMENFDYDREKGSFKTYLFNYARWKIGDQFRKRKSAALSLDARDETESGLASVKEPSVSTFEEVWNEEWRTHLISQALELVREKVSAQQFQIFHMHVIKGLAPARVAAALGIGVPMVYLAKCRVGRVFNKEIRTLTKDLDEPLRTTEEGTA